MNCRDVRELADSFLSGELPAETNQRILSHLDACPACRSDIETRRQLRGTLRTAFNRAPDLQPSNEFRDRLRERLHDAAVHRRHAVFSRQWLALAAGVVLAAGLSAGVLIERRSESDDARAHDAIGDHRNCALKYRLVRHPVPLEDAAERFDNAYRVLIGSPPEEIATPDGPARVLERHSCEYDDRRFGHVILRYHDRVVSLLVTAATSPATSSNTVPRVIGRPFEGLSVVSVNGTRHAVMLVSDLDTRELTQLAGIVAVPLVQQLADGRSDRSSLTATLLVPPLQPE
jgi:hypothetical protein